MIRYKVAPNCMKSFIGVFLLLCASHIHAQSLPAQVISTSGDNFMMTNGSLEWTLGEIMIETYSDAYFLKSKN